MDMWRYVLLFTYPSPFYYGKRLEDNSDFERSSFIKLSLLSLVSYTIRKHLLLGLCLEVWHQLKSLIHQLIIQLQLNLSTQILKMVGDLHQVLAALVTANKEIIFCYNFHGMYANCVCIFVDPGYYEQRRPTQKRSRRGESHFKRFDGYDMCI